MSLSMYQASIPVFIRMLGNLSKILDKAAAFAEAKKIDPSVLIRDRLAPDMLPFSFQIQTATDAAKGLRPAWEESRPPASPTPSPPSPS